MDGLIVQQPLIPMVWTPYGWMPMSVPEFAPGTDIYISVPVTNNSSQNVECKVEGLIHQGSELGTGDLLAEYESDPVPINQTRTQSLWLPGTANFPHTTVALGAGTFGVGIERDLTLHLYYKRDGEWVEYESGEANIPRDIRPLYMVPEVEYGFTIGQPTVDVAT